MLNEQMIIKEYVDGGTMHAIAKNFNTHATTVRRILIKHNIPIRPDKKRKGELYVNEGEKLIKWAKSQHRLVTKAELAEQIGRKKLSPSYFEKYPELGRYIAPRHNKDISSELNELYNFLNENGIPYKPDDRTALGVKVDALLLGEYHGIILQYEDRPYNVSRPVYEKKINTIASRAKDKGYNYLLLHFSDLAKLDTIKSALDSWKNRR